MAPSSDAARSRRPFLVRETDTPFDRAAQIKDIDGEGADGDITGASKDVPHLPEEADLTEIAGRVMDRNDFYFQRRRCVLLFPCYPCRTQSPMNAADRRGHVCVSFLYTMPPTRVFRLFATTGAVWTFVPSTASTWTVSFARSTSMLCR